VIARCCGTVTLSLYSEAQPERADTLTPTRTVIDKIWSDFAPSPGRCALKP